MTKNIILNFILIIGFIGVLATQYLILNKKEQSIKTNEDFNEFYFSEQINLPDSFYFEDNEQKLFVLRLIKNECRDCTDALLEAAKKIAEKLGSKRVAVWAEGYTDEEFSMYRRLNHYDIDNFHHIKKKITAFDNYNRSYYFVINRNLNGEAQFIFFPDERLPIQQKKYFKLLESVFL